MLVYLPDALLEPSVARILPDSLDDPRLCTLEFVVGREVYALEGVSELNASVIMNDLYAEGSVDLRELLAGCPWVREVVHG